MRVESEGRALPVGRAADRLQLVENRAARRLDELPDALYEGLAPHLIAIRTFGSEPALHHVLRGDPGMVGSRQPFRSTALHAPKPDEHILDRVVQPMPHMEHCGHVWRRNHDRIRIAPVRGDLICSHMEATGLQPPAVNGTLDGVGIVTRGELLAHAASMESQKPGLPLAVRATHRLDR